MTNTQTRPNALVRSIVYEKVMDIEGESIEDTDKKTE